MMKIAMIGQKGIPATSGGVEKHVEEITTRLVKQGHEVTVYCRSTYMHDISLHEYKGVRLKIIKTINNKNLDAIVYSFKATISALKEGYDVYNYHAIGPASLSFIPKIFGKKVIVTVHGLDWKRQKWGKFAKIYLKFGEWVTGKFANNIISVSENLKDYFIKQYNRKEEDVVFIPNGVNIYPTQEPDLIKDYGLYKDGYILFLSRLVPEKGAHYLIEAYNQIHTNKKLVIAGGTSFTDDYIRKLKKSAKNNKNIIFTGNVNGKLKGELYSNCYLYVLPSDIEGMPLTLLEAMSYKRGCLVSDIAENKSVIKENGFIFKKSDVSTLAKKMDILLYSSDLVNRSGKDAFKDISDNYKWENIICSLENVYNTTDIVH